MVTEGKNKGGKVLLQWETGESKKGTSNVLWIVIFFVLIIASITYAFYSKEWLMGTVFVLLIIVFAWYLSAQQKTMKISLTNRGILLDKQFYSFEKIKGYWVSEQNKTIYLLPKFKATPAVAIPSGKNKISNIIKLFPSSLIKLEGGEKDLIDKISGLLQK